MNNRHRIRQFCWPCFSFCFVFVSLLVRSRLSKRIKLSRPLWPLIYSRLWFVAYSTLCLKPSVLFLYLVNIQHFVCYFLFYSAFVIYIFFFFVFEIRFCLIFVWISNEHFQFCVSVIFQIYISWIFSIQQLFSVSSTSNFVFYCDNIYPDHRISSIKLPPTPLPSLIYLTKYLIKKKKNQNKSLHKICHCWLVS